MITRPRTVPGILATTALLVNGFGSACAREDDAPRPAPAPPPASSASPAEAPVAQKSAFRLQDPRRWPSPGRYDKRFKVAGVEHRYLAQIPGSYDEYRKYPVLFVLHDTGKKPEDLARDGVGITRSAASQNYIAVFPQGTQPTPGGGFAWADSRCNANPDAVAADGRFLKALLAEVGRQLSLASDRVFVLGIGGGAAPAYRFATEPAHGARALALFGDATCPNAGPGLPEPLPRAGSPVSALIAQAPSAQGPNADSTAPYEGLLLEANLCTEARPLEVASGEQRRACSETGTEIVTISLPERVGGLPTRIGRTPTMSLLVEFFRRAEQRPVTPETAGKQP